MIDPLLDNAVRHQVGVAHYGNYVLAKMIRVLNLTDADLVAQLSAALSDVDPESFKIQRLNKLLESVRDLNKTAYDNLYSALTEQLEDFAAYEAGFQYDLYKFVAPASFSIAAVVPAQVYAAAMAQPMEGRLLKTWVEGMGAKRLQRIKDTIAIGYTQGKTTSDIVREIRGTRAMNYTDGIIDASRREVEAVVRTAIAHTAQITRTQFDIENEDILGQTIWISTLDGRTSHACRVRDHLRYQQKKVGKDYAYVPVGHSVPWLSGPGRLHWQCRSTSISLLVGQKELYGERSSVDGPVSANLSYSSWIKQQPANVQDDVLGKTRGEMYRAGKFDISDFSNDRGRLVTLKELRERDATAFAR